MRRAIATLVGTVAVLVSLLSFKTEPRAARARPAALAPVTSSPGPTPLDTSAPATAASKVASKFASKVASKVAEKVESKTVSGASPSTAAPSHTATAKASAQAVAKPVPLTQFTGQVISTDYGPVQVRITMSGSAIRDVVALQLPGDRRRSAAISSEAGPLLRQEALTAQSARIDTVSGATYTSDGYAQSLQSALDQARVR